MLAFCDKKQFIQKYKYIMPMNIIYTIKNKFQSLKNLNNMNIRALLTDIKYLGVSVATQII